MTRVRCASRTYNAREAFTRRNVSALLVWERTFFSERSVRAKTTIRVETCLKLELKIDTLEYRPKDNKLSFASSRFVDDLSSGLYFKLGVNRYLFLWNVSRKMVRDNNRCHDERFLERERGIQRVLLKTYVINKPKYLLGLQNHPTSRCDIKARANYTQNEGRRDKLRGRKLSRQDIRRNDASHAPTSAHTSQLVKGIPQRGPRDKRGWPCQRFTTFSIFTL